jgi:hypothetical protein
MGRDRTSSTRKRPTGAAAATALLSVVLFTGCGGLAPGTISPLAGTWYGVTRNPGTTFTGKIVFDDSGDLVRMDITSPDAVLRFVFDGHAYRDDSGGTYTATAQTTFSDDTFHVKAVVQRAEGEHEGRTYITVEGTVRYGSMSGTLTIALPDEEAVSFVFDGSRR